VKEFQEVKRHHLKVASDLKADLNRISVEKQTAEMSLDTAKHDQETNQNEVNAASLLHSIGFATGKADGWPGLPH